MALNQEKKVNWNGEAVASYPNKKSFIENHVGIGLSDEDLGAVYDKYAKPVEKAEKGK